MLVLVAEYLAVHMSSLNGSDISVADQPEGFRPGSDRVRLYSECRSDDLKWRLWLGKDGC